VDATRKLAAFLVRNVPTLKVFVGASAIGFYGDRGDEVLTEVSGRGEGFLPDVCVGWESAAEPIVAAGVRVVHLRFGIVLDEKGGALAKILPVFRMGLGGRVGRGEQWMSWISIEDAARAIEFALTASNAVGAYNAVAPEPVRNREFTAELARHLRRPAVMPLPAVMVRLAFGEMGEALLLSSARVVPQRLKGEGFQFKHGNLRTALTAVLEKN
jgi:uncharacterized protein (TIGR01777 family)